MSIQTDYLRAELNAAKSDLNNQSARLAAVTAVDAGLTLLDHRDGLAEAGVVLPDLDASIVGSVYDSSAAAIDLRNASTVALKTKATILSELAALT
jgi:hypothetical protein